MNGRLGSDTTRYTGDTVYQIAPDLIEQCDRLYADIPFRDDIKPEYLMGLLAHSKGGTRTNWMAVGCIRALLEELRTLKGELDAALR